MERREQSENGQGMATRGTGEGRAESVTSLFGRWSRGNITVKMQNVEEEKGGRLVLFLIC